MILAGNNCIIPRSLVPFNQADRHLRKAPYSAQNVENDAIHHLLDERDNPGAPVMTVTVQVAEAKTHLSDLLAKVEAGEEVIISRGNTPVSRIRRDNDVDALISEIKAQRAGRADTTQDEICEWRDEGRRY